MSNVKKIILLGKNNQIYETEILKYESIYKSSKSLATTNHILKNQNSHVLDKKIRNIHFLYNQNKSKNNFHIKKKCNITKYIKDEDDMKQNQNFHMFMNSILKDNNQNEKGTDTNNIDNYCVNNKKENNFLSINRKYYDNKFTTIRKLILENDKPFGASSIFKLDYSTKQTNLEFKGLKNTNKKYFSTNRIHSRNNMNNFGKKKLHYSIEKSKYNNNMSIYTNFHDNKKHNSKIECPKEKSKNLPCLKTLSNELFNLNKLDCDKKTIEKEKASNENIHFNPIIQVIKNKKHGRIIFDNKNINSSIDLKSNNQDYDSTFHNNDVNIKDIENKKLFSFFPELSIKNKTEGITKNKRSSKKRVYRNNTEKNELSKIILDSSIYKINSFSGQTIEKNNPIFKNLLKNEGINRDSDITNENNRNYNSPNRRIPVYRI